MHVKLFRGRVTDKKSGIYIDIPSKWHAYYSAGLFIIEADKEKGCLTFLVQDRAEIIHSQTNGMPKPEYIKEGDFDTFTFPCDDKRDLKGWQTETEKYLIRFIYLFTKKDFESEIDIVLRIINSLVKYPETI
jgi:hypothetical protein